jgi:flagellar export protein FliJ
VSDSRLGGLARLRRHAEQARARALGDAAGEYRARGARSARLTTDAGEARGACVAIARLGSHGRTLSALARDAGQLAAAAAAAALDLATARTRVDAARVDAVSAMNERKAVEQAIERHRRALERERARRERREIDDVIATRTLSRPRARR